MTPVEHPESPAEFQYNLSHATTHEIVDRTFRAIQTRFRCLDGTNGWLQVLCAASQSDISFKAFVFVAAALFSVRSILQRRARPSCWPAASSTTPRSSPDWTPGPWRGPSPSSSPGASSRDPRTATARRRSSGGASSWITSAERRNNEGHRHGAADAVF